MNTQIIPVIFLLILFVTTFFGSKYWLKIELKGQSVHSKEFRSSLDNNKLTILKIYYIKIGSLILTIVLILKLIFVLLFLI